MTDKIAPLAETGAKVKKAIDKFLTAEHPLGARAPPVRHVLAPPVSACMLVPLWAVAPVVAVAVRRDVAQAICLVEGHLPDLTAGIGTCWGRRRRGFRNNLRANSDGVPILLGLREEHGEDEVVQLAHAQAPWESNGADSGFLSRQAGESIAGPPRRELEVDDGRLRDEHPPPACTFPHKGPLAPATRSGDGEAQLVAATGQGAGCYLRDGRVAG